MGKASRKKHQQRLQKDMLQKYGQVKLSDAITHLCEPFDSEALDTESYKKLIALATTAWNIALSPANDERIKKMMSALATLPDFDKELDRDFTSFLSGPSYGQELPDSVVMAQILAGLIKRKDELYPNDDRRIVDFDFKPTVNGYRLQIKSLIPKRSDG
ncbi:MAG: hypothetical protein ACXWTS_05650 [Methylococcaceae bacterium]